MSSATRRRARFGSLSYLALMGCASSLAFAAGAASAAEAPPTDGNSVSEVVITAERREEKLQDAAVTVSAVTGGQLERLGVDSSRELTQVVPGLNFTQSGFSPQPTIRGIGTRGVGSGDESVVPIYIDGVYQSFLPSLFLDLNNLQRVEVLKGPQGTLYGRNSTGGAMNFITKTPQKDFGGDGSVSYGRFNSVEVRGYLTGGTDRVAADLAYVNLHEGGYVRNVTTGGRVAGLDNYSVRGKIKVDLTDTWSATLILSNNQRIDFRQQANTPINGDSVGLRYVPTPVLPSAPWEIALDHGPIPSKVNQGAVALTTSADFANFSVNAVFSYQRNRMKQDYQDTDGTVAPIATFVIRNFDASSYNEVTFVSKGDGPFSWVAGLVYFQDDSRAEPNESISANVVTLVRTKSTLRGEQKTTSFAGYLQGTWHFNDAWSLTLGGRYTTDHKTVDNSSVVRLVTVVVDPPATVGHASATFSKFVPSGTLQYKPSERLNLYFRAGQGFKTGLFNTTSVGAPPVNPEVVTQYELGLKTIPADRVTANFAIYYTDYQNLQVTARDNVSGQAFLQNAASARLYGAEAEVTFRPISRLNVSVALSALNGKYDAFAAAQVTLPATTVDPTPATTCTMGTGVKIGGNRSVFCNVSGYNLTRTPFFTANLNADYTHPFLGGDLTWAGNIYYSGKSYWDSLNRLVEPSHVLINASIGWWAANHRVGVEIWGENLTNEVTNLSETTSATGDIHIYGPPITYGARLKVRF